jgi:hypothetical protein
MYMSVGVMKDYKLKLWKLHVSDTLGWPWNLGMFVDSEIVLSTSYGKTRVFINKTLSTETAYQQDLINRDLLSEYVWVCQWVST